jgi:quercetin dioxygenase-like cupin family protein
VRLVMKKGDQLPPHRVPGEITVQCLSGSLELGVGDDKRRLRAGEMSYLSGGTVHDVLAIDDCVALVTIALLN